MKRYISACLCLILLVNSMVTVMAAPIEPIAEEWIPYYSDNGYNKGYYFDEDGICYSTPSANDFSVTQEEIPAGMYWTTFLLQSLCITYPDGKFAVQFRGYIDNDKIFQDIERLGKLGIEAEISKTSKDYPLMLYAVLTADQIENFPAAEDVGYKLGLAKKPVSSYDETKVQVVKDNFDKGDIDGSKIIDVSDVTELSLILIGDKVISDAQYQAADVDGDGKVSLADLARIKQYLSKKIEAF